MDKQLQQLQQLAARIEIRMNQLEELRRVMRTISDVAEGR